MSEPSQAAAPPNVCRCGRPRCTSADLARWQREIDELVKAGGDGRRFDPEWGLAICWTKKGATCHMKPIEKEETSMTTTDDALAAAREENRKLAEQLEAFRLRPSKIASVSDLEWGIARAAAQQIVKLCGDSGFIAPEFAEGHLELVDRVCLHLDSILVALKIQPPKPKAS